ncbi:type II toxin-antitoxin system RatA family toxin [Pseudahrensia aquimaris]|uniref:Type II toxin-antitoxin system RatA family toxin n=1 Tax=Pseudahrensia aquimaris TaxID=744461 RepID=A0ABW3FCW1_9HYPH
MPKFSKIHRVNHRAQDMFDLVADIEKYPQFVPLCQSLKVNSEREKAGRTISLADMTVGYKAIRETFTCQVILEREALKIQASYIDGPFKYLDNRWHFEQVGDDQCDVHFSIDYEFKSRTLAMLMGSMFDRAFAHFTQAFEERADALYGRQDVNA